MTKTTTSLILAFIIIFGTVFISLDATAKSRHKSHPAKSAKSAKTSKSLKKGNSPEILYSRAVSNLESLKKDKKKRHFRDKWLQSIDAFDDIAAKFPDSPYAEKALFQKSSACEGMYRISRTEQDLDIAIEAYEQYLHNYPHSKNSKSVRASLKTLSGQDSAYEQADTRPAASISGKLSAAEPRDESSIDDSRAHSTTVSSKKKETARAVKKADVYSAPARTADGLLLITNVRFWTEPGCTKVVVDGVEGFTSGSLKNPDRLYFDIKNARLESPLKDGGTAVDDGVIKGIRASQYAQNTVRVVLDMDSYTGHNAYILKKPQRFVVDVLNSAQNSSGQAVKQEQTAKPAQSSDANMRQEAEQVVEDDQSQPAAVKYTRDASGRGRVITINPPENKDRPATLEISAEPPSRPGDSIKTTEPVKPGDQVKTDKPVVKGEPAGPETESTPSGKPSDSKSSTSPASPAKPAITKSGKATRTTKGFPNTCIVIDPGHGGKDSGAIGYDNLYEKDVVLDIGLILRDIIQKELGCKAVMTRDKDVFIDLSARPGVAIKNSADLFISIHANASPDSNAKGIETYLLNTTKDRNIMELAAKENMMTMDKMSDLYVIIKDLALDSKREESLKLAHLVQAKMVNNVMDLIGTVNDKGVKQGPFLVLYGAEMPSILTEVGFISNPEEEKLLANPDYRREIAQAIFNGIKDYISTNKSVLAKAGKR